MFTGRRCVAFATLGALVCGAAGAASAEPVAFSPGATEACLAAADAGGREACIGLSAEACIEQPDGSTTYGIGVCFGAERDYWDARLNKAYDTILQIEEATTREFADLGSAAPSSAAALRDMQRAWIAYRDASCTYEVSTWGGGSGGGPAGANCEMQLTGRQALVLEDRQRVAVGP